MPPQSFDWQRFTITLDGQPVKALFGAFQESDCAFFHFSSPYTPPRPNPLSDTGSFYHLELKQNLAQAQDIPGFALALARSIMIERNGGHDRSQPDLFETL